MSDPIDKMIVMPSGKWTYQDAGKVIFAKFAASKTLFIQGRSIVQVATGADSRQSLVRVTASAFRSLVEELGPIFAWRKGANGESVLQPSRCSEDTAKALMATRAAQDLLPKIASVVNCPIAVEDADGKLKILTTGYHPEDGGVFVTGGSAVPDLPMNEAAQSLLGLLDDYAFLSQGDVARALSSFIAPAMKMGGHLPGHVPMDVAEANLSQSGKTFRHKMTAAIYAEKLYVIAPRRGGVGGLEESVGSAMLKGRRFIQLDNIKDVVDLPFLEAVLTADSIAARVPYRGDTEVDPRLFFFFLSSNQLELTQDLLNRSSRVRISKQPLGYRFRKYREGDVLDHIVANQPYYLGCVFSLIEAWIRNGKKRTDDRRHPFRVWSQILGTIIAGVFSDLGIPDLLEGYDKSGTLMYPAPPDDDSGDALFTT